jgi:HAD superfamily hydrolase (TIGR01459 family)
MTYEIFPGIARIASRFKGILLDAYGVFWWGNEFGPFPGSKEVMEKLVSEGKIVGVLSNATQRVSKEIQKIQNHGLILGKHFHFYITSGEVARSILLHEKLPFETPRNKYFLFGGVYPKFASHVAIFQDSMYSETPDIEEADFLYISVPHIGGIDQENPEVFRDLIKNIKNKNVPMVCLNPDQFAHEGNPPRPVVRQGCIARMYEEMGGRVFYVGKPHSKVYAHAMGHYAHYNITEPSSILMVGDTPETDIRGARKVGMSSALITETGIMADKSHYIGVEKAIKALPPSDVPEFFIRRFVDDIHSSP